MTIFHALETAIDKTEQKMHHTPVKRHIKQCNKSKAHTKLKETNALLPYYQLVCLRSQAENNFAGSEIKNET